MLRNGTEGMLPFAFWCILARIVQFVDVPHMLGIVIGMLQVRIGVPLLACLIVRLASFAIPEVAHAGIVALRHAMLHLRPYFLR